VLINGHRFEPSTVLDWQHDRETPETMLLDDFILREIRKGADYHPGDDVALEIRISTRP
jgi:hypothetical protein